ncbi:cache domain-containing protein [Bdellovibrionota bacterium FG-1]
MKLAWIGILIVASFPAASFAAENCTASKKTAVCTDKIVKEQVDWACGLVEKTGKEAVDEIKIMRFDCCGEPNYVWINDMHPTMIMHPVKTQLDGKDLTTNADEDGKKLFVEFVKAATPTGAWVDYKWKKVGEGVGSPKRSWVKKCKVGSTADFWVVGSGTWK